MNFKYLLLLATCFFAASAHLRAETTSAVASRAAVACDSSTLKAVTNTAFADQEVLNYKVGFAGIKAGQGTIRVEGHETVEGQALLHVEMKLGTTGLGATLHKYSELSDSWLDASTLLSRRYTKETRESNYSADEDVKFNQACKTFERFVRRLDKGTHDYKEGALPGPTLDILGYLFYLRTLPLAEGGHYDLTLLSGDKIWPVTINVVRRLKISSPSGWHDTFYLVPTLRPGAPTDSKLKELEVWVTADAKHIPVRLRMEANVGHITAELSSAQ